VSHFYSYPQRSIPLSQSLSRFCPQCNSPLEPGQRFCTNCGATTSIESNAPTALTNDHTVLASGLAQSNTVLAQPAPVAGSNATGPTILTPNTSAPGPTPATPQAVTPDVSGATYSRAPASSDRFNAQAIDEDVIPPPPPPDSFISTPQEAPAAPYYIPPAPGNKTVPAYAQAPKRSRGCLVASIVLLLVLVLGGAGVFLVFKSHSTSGSSNQSSSSTNGQQSTPSSNGTTTSGSGNTPSTGGPVTIPLNLKFTYSSVYITLHSVQQANSFPDDSSTPQGGIRVSIKESNPTTKGTNYVYSDVVRLVFPDGTIAPPSGEQNNSAPDSGVSRDNWLDFVMTNQTIDLSKLILRFGSASQQQMDIPLIPNANLSKYQPKTVTPNEVF
jgi:hypothetical protein